MTTHSHEWGLNENYVRWGVHGWGIAGVFFQRMFLLALLLHAVVGRASAAGPNDPPVPGFDVEFTPASFVLPATSVKPDVIELTAALVVSGSPTELRFTVQDFVGPSAEAVARNVLVDPEKSDAMETVGVSKDAKTLGFRLPRAAFAKAGIYKLRLEILGGNGVPKRTRDITIERPPAKLSLGGITEVHISLTRWFPWKSPAASTEVRVFETDGRSGAERLEWHATAPPTSTNGSVPTHSGLAKATEVAAGSFVLIGIDLGNIESAGKHTFPLAITSPSAPAPAPLTVVMSVTDIWFWPALAIFLGVVCAWACQFFSQSLRPALKRMETVEGLQRVWAALRAKASGFHSTDQLEQIHTELQNALEAIRNSDWTVADTATKEATDDLAAFQKAKKEVRDALDTRARSLQAFLDTANDLIAPSVAAPLRTQLPKVVRLLKGGFVDAAGEIVPGLEAPVQEKLSQLYDLLVKDATKTPLEVAMKAAMDAFDYARAVKVWKKSGVSAPTPSAAASLTDTAEAPSTPDLTPLLPLVDVTRLSPERRRSLERAGSIFLLLTTLFIGTATGMTLLYKNQAFGSIWDYFTALLWGFGSNFTIAGFLATYQKVTGPRS